MNFQSSDSIQLLQYYFFKLRLVHSVHSPLYASTSSRKREREIAWACVWERESEKTIPLFQIDSLSLSYPRFFRSLSLSLSLVKIIADSVSVFISRWAAHHISFVFWSEFLRYIFSNRDETIVFSDTKAGRQQQQQQQHHQKQQQQQ